MMTAEGPALHFLLPSTSCVEVGSVTDGPMPQDSIPFRPGVRNGVKLISPSPVAVPPPVPGISSSSPGVKRDTEITGITVRVTMCQSPK